MAKFAYDENEDFVRGRELRGDVLGAEYNERTTQVGADDDFMGPLRQLSGEFVWGKIWSRPGLDIKTRRLINIAMLAALIDDGVGLCMAMTPGLIVVGMPFGFPM